MFSSYAWNSCTTFPLSSCCAAFFVVFLFALFFFFFWNFSTQDFFRFDPLFGFSFFLRPATFANCLGKLNGTWTLEFSTSILGVSLIFRYTCLLTLWSASSTCKQQSSKSAAREANEKNIRQRFLYLSVASNLGFSTISLPCISWIVSDLAPRVHRFKMYLSGNNLMFIKSRPFSACLHNIPILSKSRQLHVTIWSARLTITVRSSSSVDDSPRAPIAMENSVLLSESTM